MREREASRWAKRRVLTHLLTGVVNPIQERSAATAVYRALKCSAARIRRAALPEVFPGIEKIEVRVKYSPAGGGTSLSDLITLAQIVKFRNCKRMFEIGTFRGYTTFHLALNTTADSKIFTLDLPASGAEAAKLELTDAPLIQKATSGDWFRGTECEAKIAQLFGDSACFDVTGYESQMDFVFIDGSHSYSYAMADSLAAKRLLNPTGIIMWHDYPTYPGVWACLEELSTSWSGEFTWIDGTALVLWRPDGCSRGTSVEPYEMS